jgi:hypothetical protein
MLNSVIVIYKSPMFFDKYYRYFMLNCLLCTTKWTMISSRNNIIISFIFIILLGSLCLYESISIVFDHESAEKGYIIVNQSNVLIKYSPSFSLGYAGLIFVMYPILVVKNFTSLGENYLLASK